ncbi:MAG: 2-oxoacid:acceptor oxidoreductase family protein [Gemmataceae bacterium]
MLRIRFHGRGGHGMKTASRIVGTASFFSGRQAQDAPLYGAERRGAAVTAFTRIHTERILERGVIRNPDLILVADETLLADPAAGVLVGHEGASGMFVNSNKSAQDLRKQYHTSCPTQTVDVTTATIAHLGRGVALSAGIGAIACALTGFLSVEDMEEAVREELTELSLSGTVIESNVTLARDMFAEVAGVPLVEQVPPNHSFSIANPTYASGPEGVPIILHPGNAEERHTGSWRVFTPIIDRDVCTRCQICFVRCPDGAISLDEEGYPVIDYDNCKGCMICRSECPLHCVEEQKEVEAW